MTTPRWLILAILTLALVCFGAALDRRDVGGILLALYLMLKYSWLLWSLTQRKFYEKRMGKKK